MSRANSSPIKTVYIASRPEWTALAVRKDSPIKTVADLKGKKIAATKGTDPYLFTLRSLQQAGLTKDDVELVYLQHPDGRIALEKGDVDAWAGLDPHLAAIFRKCRPRPSGMPTPATSPATATGPRPWR